ncbi:hypothetical protein CDV31_016918, partial [Fusarium ambrosium]
MKSTALVCDSEGCAKTFAWPETLQEHIEVAHKGKQYVCDWEGCSKSYNRPESLKIHKKAHKGEFYVCDWEGCTRKFAWPDGLRAHKNGHKGESYVCDWKGCTMKYATPDGLRTHKKVAHRGYRYVCDWEGCNEEFTSRRYLKDHKLADHERRPYVCGYAGCGKTLQTYSGYRRHEKRHEKRHAKSSTIHASNPPNRLPEPSSHDEGDDEDSDHTSLANDEQQSLSPGPRNEAPASWQRAEPHLRRSRRLNPPVAASFRGLLTPTSTLEIEKDIEHCLGSALNLPETSTPQGESSIVRSSPTAASGFPNTIQHQQPVSLDAGPAKDGGDCDNNGDDDNDNRVQSGDFVSGEPAMMASRGGNESDRDHGAYDAHQQPDPPSKRRILEELGRYHRRKRLRNGERNASETTSAPEVEDSGQEQDPRDEPESQLPSEAESRDQPHRQPQQTAPTSNHQLPQATEDTRGRDGTPVPGAGDVEIPIDPALFNDQQACNDDEEDEDGNNASLCDDKGDAKPAIQTPSEAELRSYSPPEAISSRALLTPAATLEVEERESSTIHVLNGPHDSLSVDIQPQHTVNLDVNPAEDDGNDNGGNNGYNSPTSTLQMAENITQDRAMPVSDHGAPDSSPMAIQPQQQVSLDASPAEYGDYDNNPVPILHSEHLSRGARQQSGLKRKRQPQRYEQTRTRPRTRGRNAPKATATPEVEDSGQRQDPRDEPESQMLLESQAHHQPGESPSVRSSLTASSGFPNPTQQQPINLNTDQPRDDENSDDDRDFGHRGDNECADYDGGGDYGGDDISLGDDEAGQSAIHREAGHGRHRDQD